MLRVPGRFTSRVRRKIAPSGIRALVHSSGVPPERLAARYSNDRQAYADDGKAIFGPSDSARATRAGFGNRGNHTATDRRELQTESIAQRTVVG
jgi:hypothetical protein